MWVDINKEKPETGQICIVAVRSQTPCPETLCVALEWDGEKFMWVEELREELGEFPSELAEFWMPWPDHPEATD